MRKRIIALSFCLVLCGGCQTTAQIYEENQHKTPPIPALDAPPDIFEYLGRDEVLGRSEIDLYYSALLSYQRYVESYIEFVGTQYTVLAHQQTRECRIALALMPAQADLPKTPSIDALSDDQVVDALITHITELRTIIKKHNAVLTEKRKRILKQCHSVIFYP